MRIAVTGIGIVSAAGNCVEEVLASLRSGRSGVGRLTLFDSLHEVPVGEVGLSDGRLAKLLGIDPRRTVSRTAMLGMLAARQALDDAGDFSGAPLRTGLVSGTSVGGMDLTERFFREFMADDSAGRLRNAAGHDCGDSTLKIAAHCGIAGFATTISTACSSAANAVMFGAQLIRAGMLDRVVAGGTDALCRFTLNGFRSLMILDDAPCRPFDTSRAGLNLGEGAGYLVLQREDTLEREPYCFLSGYANANDAFHQTASSAEGTGAWLAMKGALDAAGLAPEDIGYVNAHGTGTPNNDASEAAAMFRLFGGKIPPFSSTKPFTGHTLAAAGGIEAVLSVLSVARGIIYPNLNFASPMEEHAAVPCTRYSEGNDIKHVLSNSFGFGGNNATLVFSSYR